MNTIAATTNRIPRVGQIGLVALAAAFALLMLVRSGVFGSSTDSISATPSDTPRGSVTPATPQAAPAKPKVVLLPGLPPKVAQALRSSKVAVVTLYVGQAAPDRAVVAEARKGARAAGARFVALNVGSDRAAASVASFAGPLSPPSILVVRRPGKILTQLSGQVDSKVVTQAAHNAGARR